MKRIPVVPVFLPISLAVLLAAPFVGGEIDPAALLKPFSSSTGAMIFWKIRMPRALLGWIAGGGLAAAGMVFQAIFRNALATPFTLGVSSGASLGTALALRLGIGGVILGFSGLNLGAIAGALIAIALVYGLTRLRRRCTTATMLLAGVAVNFLFASLILLIQYSVDFYDTFRILRWMMGGLQMVGYNAPLQALAAVLPVAVVLFLLSSELNLLTLGEELAVSRGMAVARIRTLLFFLVSLMVGVIVSICGPVGFVGLMCPHICRLLVGADHRRLLPASILFGGAFLVLCDTAARTLFGPTELPVGIFTSLVGGPFFLWLLLKPGRGGEPAV